MKTMLYLCISLINKMIMAMDNTRRFIITTLGEVNKIAKKHYTSNGCAWEKNGFEVRENPATTLGAYICKSNICVPLFWSNGQVSFCRKFYLIKDGQIDFDKYYDIDDISEVEGIVNVPDNFQRSLDNISAIETIKQGCDNIKDLLKGALSYEHVGGRFRIRGYFVSDDRCAYCCVEKGGIWYCLDTYSGTWQVKNVFVKDSEGNIAQMPIGDIEDKFELYFGNFAGFGHRITEKERLANGEYNKFRVRTYADKCLNTIAWFDTFEEAKQFAYKTAKEEAESIKGRNKQYAITEPRDLGEEKDYLAFYKWYDYNGCYGAVFVQGEKE